MFRCGRRCWLVQRLSLCACSRPNRSIFGLSSNSSRRTMPDRGLLFFMMWVDPLSYSYISVTDATHCWRFCFSFIFLYFYINCKSKYIHCSNNIRLNEKKKRKKKRSGLKFKCFFSLPLIYLLLSREFSGNENCIVTVLFIRCCVVCASPCTRRKVGKAAAAVSAW